MVRAADGRDLVFTVSQSVADILIDACGIKEHFLFPFLGVAILGILMTVLLSRSVTRPLTRLYACSREILESGPRENGCADLSSRGEIGGICRALHSLMTEQRRQADNFMWFSSDLVHELKTPLSAIRSSFELYTEGAEGC